MNANATQCYMARHITDGKSYRRRMLQPILAVIALLNVSALALGWILAAGGVKTVQMEWMIAFLLMGMVAGCVICLMRVGQNASRDAVVFCLVNGTTLYAIDCKPSPKGGWQPKLTFIYHFFKSLSAAADMLDRIAADGADEEILKDHAAAITQVNQLQRVSKSRFAHCSLITAGGRSDRRKFDLSNHTEALFALLKSRSPSGQWETGAKSSLWPIALSALLLLVCLLLCIASHPALALLPRGLYFPCLFVLPLPAIALGVFLLKRKRGE